MITNIHNKDFRRIEAEVKSEMAYCNFTEVMQAKCSSKATNGFVDEANTKAIP